jgi:hypothetical protein
MSEKSKENWCSKCLEAAAAFLVPTHLDAQNRQYAIKGGYLLARGTRAELRVAKWRQETSPGSRAIVWKQGDKLGVSISGIYEKSQHPRHVTISNLSSRSHRASGLPICMLDPDVFGLAGPGADEHIAADADVVARLDATEDAAKRAKAKQAATSAEADALARQIVAVLATTLDIEAESSSPKEMFSQEPRDANRYYISLSLDAAARIVAALGGTVGSLPAEPMPLWRVRYGDDGDPIYVAARTRAGVITHMMATYCHERHDDGPNVPLKPELLRIEDAGPDPELPATAKPVVAA